MPRIIVMMAHSPHLMTHSPHLMTHSPHLSSLLHTCLTQRHPPIATTVLATPRLTPVGSTLAPPPPPLPCHTCAGSGSALRCTMPDMPAATRAATAMYGLAVWSKDLYSAFVVWVPPWRGGAGEGQG